MTACELIVIGASWGGLHAVGEILAGLPGDFGPTVLIVQHRAEDSQDLLAGLLDRRGPLSVREVEDKQHCSTRACSWPRRAITCSSSATTSSSRPRRRSASAGRRSTSRSRR